MIQLTPNFDTDLLSRTDHSDLLVLNRSEALKDPVFSNLKVLAELLEELVADVFPYGVTIHDAFRCATLNTAVGGVPTSQHCIGAAADLMPIGYENDLPRAMFLAASWGLKNPKAPAFGQLLIERGCIHISLPRQRHDGEVAFWAPGNKVVWRPGN